MNDDPSPKDLAMAWMDVPFFLEALRGHESHVEFEGRALQSWDNLLRVPGRKGLLVSPSGHCWWVMLRFCGDKLGGLPSSWHGWGGDVWVEAAEM